MRKNKQKNSENISAKKKKKKKKKKKFFLICVLFVDFLKIL